MGLLLSRSLLRAPLGFYRNRNKNWGGKNRRGYLLVLLLPRGQSNLLFAYILTVGFAIWPFGFVLSGRG